MSVLEKDWITKSGLRAVCLFVHDSHRCGYVCVPKEHPLYGVAYSSHSESIGDSPDCFFDVHGGLTYSGESGKYPAEGEGWWFGFDCAHSGDATRYYASSGNVMRSLEYVEIECESLADQLLMVRA